MVKPEKPKIEELSDELRLWNTYREIRLAAARVPHDCVRMTKICTLVAYLESTDRIASNK